jgi:hypothetical protein
MSCPFRTAKRGKNFKRYPERACCVAAAQPDTSFASSTYACISFHS